MTIGIAIQSVQLVALCPALCRHDLDQPWIRDKNTWRTSLILVTTTGVSLAPWIIRNYIVFGAFVPACEVALALVCIWANPALAHTFTPDLEFETIESAPLWKARNPSTSPAAPEEPGIQCRFGRSLHQMS